MRRTPAFFRPDRLPRHALRADCQVVRQRDFRLVADRVENFSEGGLLVSPAESVLTGEPVFISLRFPESDCWLDATATVARVVHGRRPGEWTRYLGLEFDDLDRASRALLEHQLRWTPPTPPRSRLGRRAPFSARALARLVAHVERAFAS